MSSIRQAVVLLLVLAAGACGRDAEGDSAKPQELAVVEDPAVRAAADQARLPQEAEAEARDRQESRAQAASRAEAEARARAEAEAAAREAAERAAFEAAYPLHGIVVHFIAQVFAEPSNRSPVIGYMRRGSQFRAARPVRGPGCAGGWHQVPGRGFVCHGAGFAVGSEPQELEGAPTSAAVEDALPYAYAYTTGNDVAQYWRLPTPEEEDEASRVLRRARGAAEAAAAAAAAVGSELPAPDAGPPAVAMAEPGAEPEAMDPAGEQTTQADAVEAPPPPGQVEETGAPESEPADQDGVTLPDFLRMRMLRGFYVSLDRAEATVLGRRFYRTVRGAYVRATVLTTNEPPTSRGVVLGGSWALPLAIVFRSGARQYRRNSTSGRLIQQGTIARHTPLVVADDALDVDGRRYVMARHGIIVREPSVRIMGLAPRPNGVPQGAKWIHVDLSQQSLVAYEGDEPVFATLVSTGKEGHETPTGLFRIQSKHTSTTMDDDMSAEGAYSIEDVPWTMYFHGNYALHGAFWHYTFGRVRSHGCVNLSPADARWLFQWTTPTLPAAWHGIFADTRRNAGTYVLIQE